MVELGDKVLQLRSPIITISFPSLKACSIILDTPSMRDMLASGGPYMLYSNMTDFSTHISNQIASMSSLQVRPPAASNIN